MSEITKAVEARQTQITRLQSEIEVLQRAFGIVGPPAKATGTPKPKPKAAKPRAKPQPKAKAKAKKRHQWTAAEKAAIGKRMKAYWAKRQKTTAKAQPKATQKRTRKPWSAAAKKAMSRRVKASWAKRRKAKG